MTIYTGPSSAQGGVIAQAESAVFVPEIWMTNLLRYRMREFGLAKYVQKAAFAGKKGDTIKRPYIGRLRSRKKVPGRPFVYEVKKEGEWKMVVDRHTYSAFAVDGKLEYFSHTDLAKAYTPEIAKALMEDVEYSLLAERATFISYDSTNNHIVSPVPISYADFLSAYEILLEREVMPADMCFHVGPRHLVTLFTINEFIQSGVYNSGDLANIKSGTILGTIMGVPVVMNQSIRVNASDGLILGGDDFQDTVNGEAVATPGMSGSPFFPTQYGSDQHVFTLDTFLSAGYTSAMLLSKKAIALALAKTPTLKMWWDNDYGETRVLSDQIYDIKVIDPNLGVVISTDETASIADT